MAKGKAIFAESLRQLTFLWCLAWCLTAVLAECNVCQPNQVACVNESSFYLCYGTNKPNTDVLYNCNIGFDCTAFDAICVQSHYTRPPSCTANSKCGMCGAQRNYVFACLSRGTFQMCYGATEPTGSVGYCPTGHVCDATNDAVCVPEVLAQEITCDVDDGGLTPPTNDTSTEPTTPTQSTPPAANTADEWCALYGDVGVYTVEDPVCLRYVYCTRVNGVLVGADRVCATGTYFNTERRMCTVNKPTYCV